uniref:Leucine-rich repeat-containing N-terminal plant-type domain-containing protein n=1 Tax=Chenopodium quinoa TaxID=63459 RepID=A0A803LMH2_CHEQI
MPPFISSSCLSFMICLWIYSCLYMHSISSQYLDDQKSLLLELKNNLKYNSEALDKLEGWNHSTNYCQWSGVECDNSNNGKVLGLDLSNKNIIGGIDNTSSLFRLQFLQSLNLGGENKIQDEIPSAIGKLSSLTYLNLSTAPYSDTNFRGQVPIEISNLVKLVVLDISFSFRTYMNRPNLADIVRNLTNIRELYLDRVNISAIGSQWCQTLASSLPHLQVLSMSECHLEGEIHNSLSRLHRLSVIRLGINSLVGPVPEFLTRLTNLTMLSLSSNDLTGIVPHKIFQVPTLRTLDISGNSNLEGTLPVFYINGSLEELTISGTKFSGVLPSSISNLKSLRTIFLVDCQFNGSLPSSIGSLNLLQRLVLTANQFSGSIPSSIGSLNLLEDLELNDNQFSGHIPSFSSLKKLKTLNLHNNSLVGSITGKNWEKLLNLESLSLSFNSLDGNISSSLFSLPSLEFLALENNKFSGQLNESANPVFSKLTEVYLSSNNLEGPIPKSIFHLRQLEWLDLSSNSFNGTLKLAEILLSLKNLTSLNLSFNRLLGAQVGVGNSQSEPFFQPLGRARTTSGDDTLK